MLSLRLSKAVASLPVSVAQLATSAGMIRPGSLRGSTHGIRRTDPTAASLRAALPVADAEAGGTFVPPWPDGFYDQVLSAPNGWSLHDYWYRVTDGLVDLDFDLQGWNTLPADQAAPGVERPPDTGRHGQETGQG